MRNSLTVTNSLSLCIIRVLDAIPFISMAIAITGVSENPATKPLVKRTYQRLQDRLIHQNEVQYWCVVWNQLH